MSYLKKHYFQNYYDHMYIYMVIFHIAMEKSTMLLSSVTHLFRLGSSYTMAMSAFPSCWSTLGVGQVHVEARRHRPAGWAHESLGPGGGWRSFRELTGY